MKRANPGKRKAMEKERKAGREKEREEGWVKAEVC
jgi:hypothetical protein